MTETILRPHLPPPRLELRHRKEDRPPTRSRHVAQAGQREGAGAACPVGDFPDGQLHVLGLDDARALRDDVLGHPNVRDLARQLAQALQRLRGVDPLSVQHAPNRRSRGREMGKHPDKKLELNAGCCRGHEPQVRRLGSSRPLEARRTVVDDEGRGLDQGDLVRAVHDVQELAHPDKVPSRSWSTTRGEPAREVALSAEADRGRSDPEVRGTVSHMHGGGRSTDPALVVDDGYGFHGQIVRQHPAACQAARSSRHGQDGH